MDTTQLIQALREFSTTELCDGMTEFRVLDPAIQEKDRRTCISC